MQKSLPVFYWSSILLFYFWGWGLPNIFIVSNNNEEVVTEAPLNCENESFYGTTILMGPEICNNGIDDDGDGDIDCADSDCDGIVVNLKNDTTICSGDDITLTASMSVCNAPTCGGTSVSSFPYTNSFNNTLGDWTQDTNDDFNWTYDVDATTSS